MRKLLWLSVLVCGSACGGDALDSPANAAAYPGRKIVAAEWDTLGWIGPADVSDTTFIRPAMIVEWAGRLAVLDRSPPGISLFSREGELLWRYAREGPGPEELQWIGTAAATPWGDLWVSDSRNNRIVEFTLEGRIRRTLPIHHFPATVSAVAFPSRDRALFSTYSPLHRVVVTGTDSLQILQTFESLWADSAVGDANLRAVGNAEPGSGIWVQALQHGPGFVVGSQGSEPRLFRYVSHVPWAQRVHPAMRSSGADSARYGAVDAEVMASEIFLLFGGRPFRAAHAAEPTVLVDVYRSDGEYSRSYLLPVDTEDFAMLGGDVLALLSTHEGVYPRIFLVRPTIDDR